MQSALYEADHEAFRATVREFLAKEVVPHHPAWEEAGVVDRDVWVKAGAQGLLGMDVPEEYGGGGVKDFRYNAVLAAEVSRVGASGLGFTLHNDVAGPYPKGQRGEVPRRLHRRDYNIDHDNRPDLLTHCWVRVRKQCRPQLPHQYDTQHDDDASGIELSARIEDLRDGNAAKGEPYARAGRS